MRSEEKSVRNSTAETKLKEVRQVLEHRLSSAPREAHVGTGGYALKKLWLLESLCWRILFPEETTASEDCCGLIRTVTA